MRSLVNALLLLAALAAASCGDGDEKSAEDRARDALEGVTVPTTPVPTTSVPMDQATPDAPSTGSPLRGARCDRSDRAAAKALHDFRDCDQERGRIVEIGDKCERADGEEALGGNLYCREGIWFTRAGDKAAEEAAKKTPPASGGGGSSQLPHNIPVPGAPCTPGSSPGPGLECRPR